MNVRRAVTVGGAGAAIAGLALVFVPGLAEQMGVARLFVLVLGVAAALLLIFDVRALVLTEVDQADPPDVEEAVEHPRAGEAVDDLLAAATQGYDRYTQDSRDRLEARVREVAVDVLARQEDCRPEDVETMLVEGSWTDDPYAAAFLGAHEVEDLPLRERVANALRPEARFARRATHAIDAIADRAAVDREVVARGSTHGTDDRETTDGDTSDGATADEPTADGRATGSREASDREAADREVGGREVDVR